MTTVHIGVLASCAIHPILYRKHVVLYIGVDGTLDFFFRPVNFDIAFRYDDPFR